jgi:5'-nucleotidase
VQLLGINDFHGNLEPPTGSGGRIQEVPGGPQIDAGGAVYLATQLRTLRQQNPNTLTVSAGDLIGASPLLSALFHDEPTIEAMNEIGLDLNAVGNHEFDEGVTELLRMRHGGCGPDNSCPKGSSAARTSSSWPPTWSTRTRASRSSRRTRSRSSATSRSASSG